MALPRAVLSRHRQEEAPLWLNPVGPILGKTACSRAWRWLLATRSHRASLTSERSGTADRSQSRRGTRLFSWSVQKQAKYPLVRRCMWAEKWILFACGRDRTWVRYHFSEDASQTPDVHGCGVVLTTQEDFWRPVPESDHLGSITDSSF